MCRLNLLYYPFILLCLLTPACALFPLEPNDSLGSYPPMGAYSDDWRVRGGFDVPEREPLRLETAEVQYPGAFDSGWVQNYREQHPNRASSSDYSFENPIERAKAYQDVTLGMTMQDVESVWGQPGDVEIAGNPHYGNQRWTYYLGLSGLNLGKQRIVYFENGRVAGWQSSR